MDNNVQEGTDEQSDKSAEAGDDQGVEMISRHVS
jgi:hypothetical protein